MLNKNTIFSLLLLCLTQGIFAQTVVTRWDFNSNPADASNSTGEADPATGTGSLTGVGGVATSFASGSANGGSSDPAATDNTGLALTTWAAQGTADRTAGLEFAVSTTGFEDMVVSFDLRHSNTGPRHLFFQYTADVTAGSPVWVDFAVDSATSGDSWNPRLYDLSTITALDNNPNAGFRVVAGFRPGTPEYVASGDASSYAVTGSWRFDMVTVSGTAIGADNTPPVAQSYKIISNTASYIRFSEPVSSSMATNVANYAFTPSITLNSAIRSASGDTLFLDHAAIVDGQDYTLTVSGVEDLAGNITTITDFPFLYNASVPDLVITEFVHSPNTIEMIEVYNAGGATVNLNGLKWTDGTTGNFPNTTLAAGATILFSTVPSSAASLFGTGIYYLINSGLGGANDQLVIRNSINQLIDSLDYYVNTNGWPAAASGVYGYSFELNSSSNDNNAGTNWSVPQHIISSANGTILATPGVYPTPAADPAPQVLSYKQLSATSTYVVFNQQVVSASATTTSNYVFNPVLTVQSAVLSSSGDTVFLTHAALSDGLSYTLTVSGVVNSSNVSNTTANLDLIWNQSAPQLVITEIIHSPNDIEMIEIYNAGGTAVNLGGLKWTDGTAGNFPVVSLPVGGKALFATSPATTASILNVSPVYTITAGLSGSNDILVIRNSLNQVVDSVSYFVGTNGWPVAPTGVYGYSFELNSTGADNNAGSSWSVPLNTVTPQPFQGVVRATPSVYPPVVVTPPNTNVSFVGTKANVSETMTEVMIVASLTNGNTNPSSVDLELVPFGTADAGVDFALPGSMLFNWAANANNVNDTIIISISNDALPEDAEYFALKLVSPVNTDLPSNANNNFTVFILDDDKQAPVATEQIKLNYLTSIGNGTPGPNSAEIVAHDPASQRLFIANSLGARIDIVDFHNPAAPVLIDSISVTPYGNINSIAVRNGIVAAAVENSIPESPGKIVFFDTLGNFISQVSAGAMPDMICFNHAGDKVLTANEGQPDTSYTVDPEGSVTIVDISGGVASVSQSDVTTAGFGSYNAQAAALKAQGIRIFGPGSTVAQDLEPEYITFSDDDQTAWVTCQENNAIAKIDMTTGTVTELMPLGTKDHFAAGNALDANDQGGVVQMARWPVKGVYMPDAIASYQSGGQTYLVTANEGDAREYSAYSEVVRVSDPSYVLDSASFPYRDLMKANLGRLNVTTASGDTDGDGDYDEIHAYGGRSISIWNGNTGELVWDSGDDMELITSKHPVYGSIFNASNANNTFKNRSDDKGPEPEGIAIATIKGNVFAFVALERTGGCMVYNITDPSDPVYVDYKNSRDLGSYGGDNGAEGIIYIDAAQSPNGQPIVILANEVSSTLAIYQVEGPCIASHAEITPDSAVAICSGSNIALTASAGSSYHWSNGATTQSILAIQAGSYRVVINSPEGCVDTSSYVSIVVKSIPQVKIKNLDDLKVCEGNSVPFTADSSVDYSGFSYQWNLDGTPVSGATNSLFNATAAGKISLTVSGGTGCSKTSSSKTVGIKPHPVAAFTTAGAVAFCEGGSVSLEANALPDYKFTWLNDGVKAATGTVRKAKEGGNYTVVGSLNGCTDTSAPQQITVYALPASAISTADDVLFCSSDSAVLEASPVAAGNTYQWQVGTNIIAGAEQERYAGIATGSYKVFITDINGCGKLSPAFKLKTESTPSAIITAQGSTTIASNGQVKLKATGGAGFAYQWYRGGADIVGATDKDYVAMQGGDYTVLVTKGNCSALSAPLTVIQVSVREVEGVTAAAADLSFELVAYPNPVSQELNVTVRGLEQVDGMITVMDMNGRMMVNKPMKQASVSIDMGAYAPCTYLVRFKDNTGSTGTLKVVRQ
jgi:hypothetical protein